MFIVSLAGFGVHWPNLLPDQKCQEIGRCKQIVRALQNSAPRELLKHDPELTQLHNTYAEFYNMFEEEGMLDGIEASRGPYAYSSKHSPDRQLREKAPMHRPRQHAGRGRGRAEAGAARRLAARLGVAKAGTTRTAARMHAARLGKARS